MEELCMNNFIIDLAEQPFYSGKIVKDIIVLDISPSDELKKSEDIKDSLLNAMLVALNKEIQRSGKNVTVYILKTTDDRNKIFYWICPISGTIGGFKSRKNLEIIKKGPPFKFPAFSLLVSVHELAILLSYDKKVATYRESKFNLKGRKGVLKIISNHFKEMGFNIIN